MVKLDANIFKKYFLLIKETLETKLIGKDGKYHNAFYICDEDSYYHGDNSKVNTNVNEQIKLLVPPLQNKKQENDYMCVKFALNCKDLFDNENFVYFFEPNFTLVEHTYQTSNYINTTLDRVDDKVLKNETNIKILKELAKKVDDYNEWTYHYIKDTYFNSNYEVIYRPSINKRINKYEIYKLLKSKFNNSARILFYSYINEDRVTNIIRLDNYSHFDKCFSLFADKDGIRSQYGRSFEEVYKLHSIVKNKDNDEIRILYSLDDKYKCDCHYINNVSSVIAAEMNINNNEELYKRLINIK